MSRTTLLSTQTNLRLEMRALVQRVRVERRGREELPRRKWRAASEQSARTRAHTDKARERATSSVGERRKTTSDTSMRRRRASGRWRNAEAPARRSRNAQHMRRRCAAPERQVWHTLLRLRLVPSGGQRGRGRDGAGGGGSRITRTGVGGWRRRGNT